MKKIFYLIAIAPAVLLMTSCGEESTTEGTEEITEEIIVDPCPETCDLNVQYSANSQGQDSALYENNGNFDVMKTSIVYFHDSTMVLKIDNYEGKRETGDQIQLYVSLYTKNGEHLQEGDYSFDYKEALTTNLLIYTGTGMLICPAHIAEGGVTVTSYSKEKVCGNIDISMLDETGNYGSIQVSGDFIVEK